MIDEQKYNQATSAYGEETPNSPGGEGESQESQPSPDRQASEATEPEAKPPAESVPESGQEPEQVIAALQQEVATLNQQLEAQTQQVDTFKAQYVRIAADFDNVRKRHEQEKEEIEYRVKRNVISELLTSIDSFERARLQLKPANDGEMRIHKSYQGVYKQIVDGLKRVGVSAMRSEGEPFDPSFHEAVFREPSDEYPEGTVIEQVMRGYLLGDRVLRHAMVKVAVAPEPETATEAEGSQPENGAAET